MSMIKISLVPSPNMVHSGMPTHMVINSTDATFQAPPVTLVSSGWVVALAVLTMAVILIRWQCDRLE